MYAKSLKFHDSCLPLHIHQQAGKTTPHCPSKRRAKSTLCAGCVGKLCALIKLPQCLYPKQSFTHIVCIHSAMYPVTWQTI